LDILNKDFVVGILREDILNYFKVGILREDILDYFKVGILREDILDYFKVGILMEDILDYFKVGIQGEFNVDYSWDYSEVLNYFLVAIKMLSLFLQDCLKIFFQSYSKFHVIFRVIVVKSRFCFFLMN